MVVLTTSDYIQIITAGIYAAALSTLHLFLCLLAYFPQYSKSKIAYYAAFQII
jgi:hypothetical protein